MMNTRDGTKYSSITPHLKSLESQVDKAPDNTHHLRQLYRAYRRAGRLNDASEIQAMLSIPDSRSLEE